MTDKTQEKHYLSVEIEPNQGYGWVKWYMETTGEHFTDEFKRKITYVEGGKSTEMRTLHRFISDFKFDTKGSIIADKETTLKGSISKVEISDYWQSFDLAQTVIEEQSDKYCFEKAVFYEADLVFDFDDNIIDPIFTDGDTDRLMTRAFVNGVHYFEKRMGRMGLATVSISCNRSPYGY